MKYDKYIYVFFENDFVIPSSMDADTLLRYIESLNIKKLDSEILELTGLKKHKKRKK